jgi:glycosyltransferase involved in cell wall biosynthesis
MIGVHKGCMYHATDEAESIFIKKTFGQNKQVYIAQNFPKAVTESAPLYKMPGELKIVSIAMISPMKNINLVIKALKELQVKVEYDIFGAIKDEEYWRNCLLEIKNVAPFVTITYRGGLQPNEVIETLKNYHFFVLPSKSENFGHAIFEALASGKPVITSHYTPWNGLEEKKAGFNVSIDNPDELAAAIKKAALLSSSQYGVWSGASRNYALESIDVEKTKEDYRRMFNVGT